MVALVWKPKHVAIVNKRIFCNPDGCVGMKTETCSCCKQKGFCNPDDGVGMKDEICIYLLWRRGICLPVKLCVTGSTSNRSFVLEKTTQCHSPRVPFEQRASKPHKSQTLRVVCNYSNSSSSSSCSSSSSSSKLLCHYAWYCFMWNEAKNEIAE